MIIPENVTTLHGDVDGMDGWMDVDVDVDGWVEGNRWMDVC